MQEKKTLLNIFDILFAVNKATYWQFTFKET